MFGLDISNEMDSGDLFDTLFFFLNNLTDETIDRTAKCLRVMLTKHTAKELALLLIQNRVALEANHTNLYVKLFLSVESNTFHANLLIAAIKHAMTLMDKGYVKLTQIRSLGSFLGLMTYGRGVELPNKVLDLVELLEKAGKEDQGRMRNVVAFVISILGECKDSKVFNPSHPKIRPVFDELKKIYAMDNIKLNLKFEIESLLEDMDTFTPPTDALIPSCSNTGTTFTEGGVNSNLDLRIESNLALDSAEANSKFTLDSISELVKDINLISPEEPSSDSIGSLDEDPAIDTEEGSDLDFDDLKPFSWDDNLTALNALPPTTEYAMSSCDEDDSSSMKDTDLAQSSGGNECYSSSEYSDSDSDEYLDSNSEFVEDMRLVSSTPSSTCSSEFFDCDSTIDAKENEGQVTVVSSHVNEIFDDEQIVEFEATSSHVSIDSMLQTAVDCLNGLTRLLTPLFFEIAWIVKYLLLRLIEESIVQTNYKLSSRKSKEGVWIAVKCSEGSRTFYQMVLQEEPRIVRTIKKESWPASEEFIVRLTTSLKFSCLPVSDQMSMDQKYIAIKAFSNYLRYLTALLPQLFTDIARKTSTIDEILLLQHPQQKIIEDAYDPMLESMAGVFISLIPRGTKKRTIKAKIMAIRIVQFNKHIGRTFITEALKVFNGPATKHHAPDHAFKITGAMKGSIIISVHAHCFPKKILKKPVNPEPVLLDVAQPLTEETTPSLSKDNTNERSSSTNSTRFRNPGLCDQQQVQEPLKVSEENNGDQISYHMAVQEEERTTEPVNVSWDASEEFIARLVTCLNFACLPVSDQMPMDQKYIAIKAFSNYLGYLTGLLTQLFSDIAINPSTINEMLLLQHPQQEIIEDAYDPMLKSMADVFISLIPHSAKKRTRKAKNLALQFVQSNKPIVKTFITEAVEVFSRQVTKYHLPDIFKITSADKAKLIKSVNSHCFPNEIPQKAVQAEHLPLDGAQPPKEETTPSLNKDLCDQQQVQEPLKVSEVKNESEIYYHMGTRRKEKKMVELMNVSWYVSEGFISDLMGSLDFNCLSIFKKTAKAEEIVSGAVWEYIVSITERLVPHLSVIANQVAFTVSIIVAKNVGSLNGYDGNVMRTVIVRALVFALYQPHDITHEAYDRMRGAMEEAFFYLMLPGAQRSLAKQKALRFVQHNSHITGAFIVEVLEVLAQRLIQNYIPEFLMKQDNLSLSLSTLSILTICGPLNGILIELCHGTGKPTHLMNELRRITKELQTYIIDSFPSLCFAEMNEASNTTNRPKKLTIKPMVE